SSGMCSPLSLCKVTRAPIHASLPTISVVVDPFNSATVYAGINEDEDWIVASGTVAKSTDAGATWTFSALPSGVLALAIDPFEPTTIYAGTQQVIFDFSDTDTVWGDVFTSTDGG